MAAQDLGPPPPHRTPTLWAVHDGKIGMANQVMGLAEALGYPIIQKSLVFKAPWRHLAPPFWFYPLAALSPEGALFTPPWPDIVIGCGRLVIAPCLAAKRLSGGRIFWVQIQDPRFARQKVDLMVVPEHDPARGPNVLVTQGAVHRVTAKVLEDARPRFQALFASLQRPLIGVMIGGSNRAYRLTEPLLAQLGDRLAALARQGYGIAITASRRTEEAGMTLLREKLAATPHFLWDGTGDNPYFGLLAHADAFIVTSDSVNMVSEAAATGKPIHIVELDGGSAKFRRFHELFKRSGITRPFTGTIEHWSYTPPDDTARAAAEIRRLMANRPHAMPLAEIPLGEIA